jgi:hypothetical protein
MLGRVSDRSVSVSSKLKSIDIIQSVQTRIQSDFLKDETNLIRFGHDPRLNAYNTIEINLRSEKKINIYIYSTLTRPDLTRFFRMIELTRLDPPELEPNSKSDPSPDIGLVLHRVGNQPVRVPVRLGWLQTGSI